jgi:hypothetical protein
MPRYCRALPSARHSMASGVPQLQCVSAPQHAALLLVALHRALHCCDPVVRHYPNGCRHFRRPAHKIAQRRLERDHERNELGSRMSLQLGRHHVWPHSSRSRRPTHHLWRFDARRDARLVFWPKAASAVERGGVYAPHQQPPRKPRRPSLHHHPVKGAGVFPASLASNSAPRWCVGGAEVCTTALRTHTGGDDRHAAWRSSCYY